MVGKNNFFGNECVIEKIDGADLTVLIVFLNRSLTGLKWRGNRFYLVYIVIIMKKIDPDLCKKQRADQANRRDNMQESCFQDWTKVEKG
ncbi:hypothetical protein WSM22_05220 [Cytophagales bacterium WSM2-2]|nr:hypothetical protein WSM22_05220 [Cytophagales bacterium WSM2-2]